MAALAHAAPFYGGRDERRVPSRRHLSDRNLSFRPPASLSVAEITEAKESSWITSVLEQFESIAGLPPGWDAGSAGPIRRDVLDYALAILEVIMHGGTAPPHVTPMSHEGVMLEWHSDDLDLEIEIMVPGNAYVTIKNRKTGEEKELRLVADFRELADYFLRSMKPA